MTIPNTLRICDCEHPIFSNKETIEYSEIKCDVCGKVKTTKKSGGCY